MIVDDEKRTREGMKRKVNWPALGMSVAAEASDGEEALEQIHQRRIDLVITDVSMPVMDGLTFIQRALEKDQRLKFIIVSGYSEFEYARAAMKLGISEYLLKPLKESDILASLVKMKRAIAAQQTVTQKELAKQQEDAFLHWLTGSAQQETILASELQQVTGEACQAAAVLKAELEASNDSAGRLRSLTLHYDIESLFREMFPQEAGIRFMRCLRPEHDYVLLLPAGQNKAGLLDSFLQELMHRHGITAAIGLGEACGQGQCLKRSYQEALFAVKETLLRGSEKVISYSSIEARREQPKRSCQTKLLLRWLQERKRDHAKEQIAALFEHALQQRMVTNHQHAYELFMEIYFVLKEFVQAEGAGYRSDPVSGEATHIMDIAAGFTRLEQMVSWLQHYVDSCYMHPDGQDVTGKEIVFSVKKHIDEFYSSELTLNHISEKYHINPIYFSRIFKAFIGESFNSYITRIRMEEALRLMETTSLKLHEIAEIVGYEDPKYFSKVFKKFYGTSPSSYGEQAQLQKV